MKEDRELGRRMIEEMRAAGFPMDRPLADRTSMLHFIRELDTLPSGSVLSEGQRVALLENLRFSGRTIETGFVPSIRQQASLPRWRFLREVSPLAGAAYYRALLLAGIKPPPYLLD